MATIRDIAGACGVCTSVVSYVINNSRPVAPQTRIKVLRAMEEMNYHPSAIARGLSRKRMNCIGVIFSQIYSTPLTNPFFGPIFDSIVSTAMDRQQSTSLFTWPTWDVIAANQSVYCDCRCDGLILLAPDLASNIVPIIRARGLPFIVVAQTVPQTDVASIDIDNYMAARAAVRHLIDLGHRNIAILSGDTWAAGMKARIDGYRQALTDASLPCDEELTCIASCDVTTVPEQIKKLLSHPAGKRPTAIFFGNDEAAIAGMAVLRSLGLEVPGDISVVGFDDIQAAANADPPLTTVSQPLNEFGSAGVSKLLKLIDGDLAGGLRETLPADLIVRGSTAPPPDLRPPQYHSKRRRRNPSARAAPGRPKVNIKEVKLVDT